MKTLRSLSLLALTLITSASVATSEDRVTGPAKVRIGVYDNRSVAIAYASSDFNPVGKKAAELKLAEEAGDQEKVAELKTWGATHQKILHFQGFGRVPVDDLLVHVKDLLPSLMKKHSLVAIVPRCDATTTGIETVDVSLELAKLFDPSAAALENADRIRKQKPVDLATLATLKTGN